MGYVLEHLLNTECLFQKKRTHIHIYTHAHTHIPFPIHEFILPLFNSHPISLSLSLSVSLSVRLSHALILFPPALTFPDSALTFILSFICLSYTVKHTHVKIHSQTHRLTHIYSLPQHGLYLYHYPSFQLANQPTNQQTNQPTN